MSSRTFRTRPATPDDLPWQDRAAMTQGYTSLLTGALHDPEAGSALLVLEDPAGQALGFTLLYGQAEERAVFIKDPAVSEAAEGSGAAPALMGVILDWARARGAREVLLTTSWFNTRARAFSARSGFQEDHVALVYPLE